MKCYFCDLCGCPIHGVKYSLILATEDEIKNLLPYAINSSFQKKIDGVNREICEVCKNILEKLFVSRKKGLEDFIKTIEETFKLTSKKPPKNSKK